MGLSDVRAGIHTNLRAFTTVTNIIAGMPTNIHTTPAIITQFSGCRRVGQTMYFEWRFLLHAVMDHQVNELGEGEVDEMAEPVIEAFSPKLTDTNGHFRSRLGGTAQDCWFEDIRSGDADGYIPFGEKTYRRIAFALVVKTHEVY